MRLLFVITDLGVGGAERQVLDLADHFAGTGMQVTIAYLTGTATLKPAHPAVEVAALGMGKSARGFMQGYLALRRLIAHLQPDVVHSHMVHANLLTRLVRLTQPMALLVCTAHSMNEGGVLRMLAYRLTNRLSEVFTNVGSEAVQSFERKGAVAPGRMLALPNGIDVDKFRFDGPVRARLRAAAGIGTGQSVILAVGRLATAKDYPTLLRAFADVYADDQSVQLWIAGGGELEASLRAQAVDLGLAAVVRFLGVRDDVAALFQAADVYTLSSAWEGLPLVVGEAMASEKVVVATDCGGVREMIGDCGVLVAPGDSHALAKALQAALGLSSEQALERGRRARQRVVEQFSLAAVAARWQALYCAGVKQKREGR